MFVLKSTLVYGVLLQVRHGSDQAEILAAGQVQVQPLPAVAATQPLRGALGTRTRIRTHTCSWSGGGQLSSHSSSQLEIGHHWLPLLGTFAMCRGLFVYRMQL